MPGGLVALLDDIAVIAKLAAASVDDVAGAAGKAGTKAAGVVIDDTAVTPNYVVGLSPERELPIIYKITKGSLRNKLFFLLPAAIALSALAPWAITPLLMLGGAYLCFEATEKIWQALTHTTHAEEVIAITDPHELEERQVDGAVRTDFILSAEIMAIALAEVATEPFWTRATILALVGIAITIGVYGVVGLIVKMDDIGLHLAARKNRGWRALGGGLVRAMPSLMSGLSVVGIAAMIWVGGGIIVHGLEEFGLSAIGHAIHDAGEAAGHAVPAVGDAIEWAVGAAGSWLVGLAIGGLIVAARHKLARKP
jgi:uncharacterized protein